MIGNLITSVSPVSRFSISEPFHWLQAIFVVVCVSTRVTTLEFLTVCAFLNTAIGLTPRDPLLLSPQDDIGPW